VRDGPVRTAIKRAALAVYDFRLRVHRARARENGDIRYELGGACALCAKCCEAPAIQVSFVTWHFPLIRRLFLLWHRHVNGFELVSKDRKDRCLVFRCTHFDLESRRCDSYDTRPGMCRDYPRLFLEQANPELFDTCGFKPVALARGRLLTTLEDTDLTSGQLEKLKKELYLEE
jgi:hypothetical protein